MWLPVFDPVFLTAAPLFLGTLVYATSTLTALPLSVKSPYLHHWIVNPEGADLTASSALFWTTTREFSWTGLIRVDGVGYQWFGAGDWSGERTIVLTLDRFLTPTRSIFTIQAGPIKFNVTFLSPIEPDDLALQSLPFTYMFIDGLTSTDNQPHNIQVYSDISAQWTSGSDHEAVVWSTQQTPTGSVVYHTCNKDPPSSISKTLNMAEDATVYYAMSQQPFTTWMTGQNELVRGTFLGNGTLPDSQDTRFRRINDDWPVFAFARDLGTVSSLSSPVVWAVGLVRDPVITFSNGSGPRMSYFWSQWSSIDDAIQDFVNGFPAAEERSRNLDQKIQRDASTISSDYVDLVSLALRQTFAGVDITLPGTPNHLGSNVSDVRIYLKNIGYDMQTSPIETVYSTFPAFLYINATMARYLLTTILDYQAQLYPNASFAVSNFGTTYPIISDLPQSSSIARNIESEHFADTGNVLIMSLAYSVKTGDVGLIATYYDMFAIWADNLMSQMSQIFASSDFGPNSGPDKVSPNVILQGIIGLYCMATVTSLLKREPDSTLLQGISNLVPQWDAQAVKSDHILATFGVDSTGLAYNTFPLTLLGIKNLLPQEILDMQEEFENRRITRQQGQMGPTLEDSDGPGTIETHLVMLATAMLKNKDTRDGFVGSVHKLAFTSINPKPFASTFNATNLRGNPKGIASPGQGAMFALLAVNLPNSMELEVVLPLGCLTDKSSCSKGTSKAGLIAGTVIAAVIAFAIILAFLYQRRKRRLDSQRLLPLAHPVDLHAKSRAQDIRLMNPLSGSDDVTAKPLPPVKARYHPVRAENRASELISVGSLHPRDSIPNQDLMAVHDVVDVLWDEVYLLLSEMRQGVRTGEVTNTEQPPSYHLQ